MVYVVIYDVPIDARGVDVREEYYGHFSSVKEAREQYEAMREPNYRNARVCLIVEQIEDETRERVEVIDGRIVEDDGRGTITDLTDQARRVITALAHVGSSERVWRPAQDIANEFGWFDQPEDLLRHEEDRSGGFDPKTAQEHGL